MQLILISIQITNAEKALGSSFKTTCRHKEKERIADEYWTMLISLKSYCMDFNLFILKNEKLLF